MPGIGSVIKTLVDVVTRGYEAAVVATGYAPGGDPLEFAVAGTRRFVADGFRVELDLGSQVLQVSGPPADFEEMLKHSAAARARYQLTPTIGKRARGQPASAALLAQKAKIFDDGLMAAIEIAAQEGEGLYPGKASLIESVCRSLVGEDPAVAGEVQALMFGAARLGRVTTPHLSPELETGAQRAIAEFLSEVGQPGKPISFYTWSERLASIFQQDRMLQRGIEDQPGVAILAGILRADPVARATYEAHLRLISRLTNPLDAPDLRMLLAEPNGSTLASRYERIAFFPPSVAHETELLRKLFPGGQTIPDDFVLINALIDRIRARELKLQPTPESGWYDYLTWTLEPLVVPERMPEAPRLLLDEDYKRLLQQLFEGLLALARETHTKQLPPIFTGAFAPYSQREVVLLIAPKLTAEPLPTFYLRRALGYRFVRGVLEDTFGAKALERMHRLRQHGATHASLAEELAEMEALFVGAHVSVNRQLGLLPDAQAGNEATTVAAARQFATWAGRLHADPDLREDVRAMVPVFYDLGRRKMKVWVFMGWEVKPVTVTFAHPPAVRITPLGAEPTPRMVWVAQSMELAYPVTAELYVDQILDREEFRHLCDEAGTASEIIRRLTA